MPFEILLAGVAIASANDAATAVAEHLAESEEKFVERMNAEGERMGLTHTVFANPHGLPDAGSKHAGDLGNIVLDDAGAGTLTITANAITLDDGGASVIGRTIVVHANPDDGTAGDAGPGNSGGRIGCGVIQLN